MAFSAVSVVFKLSSFSSNSVICSEWDSSILGDFSSSKAALRITSVTGTETDSTVCFVSSAGTSDESKVTLSESDVKGNCSIETESSVDDSIGFTTESDSGGKGSNLTSEWQIVSVSGSCRTEQLAEASDFGVSLSDSEDSTGSDTLVTTHLSTSSSGMFDITETSVLSWGFKQPSTSVGGGSILIGLTTSKVEILVEFSKTTLDSLEDSGSFVGKSMAVDSVTGVDGSAFSGEFTTVRASEQSSGTDRPTLFDSTLFSLFSCNGGVFCPSFPTELEVWHALSETESDDSVFGCMVTTDSLESAQDFNLSGSQSNALLSSVWPCSFFDSQVSSLFSSPGLPVSQSAPFPSPFTKSTGLSIASPTTGSWIGTVAVGSSTGSTFCRFVSLGPSTNCCTLSSGSTLR